MRDADEGLQQTRWLWNIKIPGEPVACNFSIRCCVFLHFWKVKKVCPRSVLKKQNCWKVVIFHNEGSSIDQTLSASNHGEDVSGPWMHRFYTDLNSQNPINTMQIVKGVIADFFLNLRTQRQYYWLNRTPLGMFCYKEKRTNWWLLKKKNMKTTCMKSSCCSFGKAVKEIRVSASICKATYHGGWKRDRGILQEENISKYSCL